MNFWDNSKNKFVFLNLFNSQLKFILSHQFFYLFILALVPVIDLIKVEPNATELTYWTNESFVLTCADESLVPSHKILWYKDGSLLESNPNIQLAHPSSHELQVLFYDTKKEKSGNYTCVITDHKSNEVYGRKSIIVRLFDPIVFVGNINQNIRRNHNGRLYCNFKSDPAFSLDIDWYRNGSKISTNSEKYNIYEKSELEIYNAELADSGKYYCRVVARSDFKTEFKMFPINLHVVYPPKFLPNMTDKAWFEQKVTSKSIENKLVMVCAVDANPKAKIIWSLGNKQPLRNSLNYNYTVEETENKSVLKLIFGMNSGLEETGLACQVANELGTDFRTFQFESGQLPTAPNVLGYEIDNNILTVSIKSQNVTPPIDVYRVKISNKYFDFKAEPNKENYTVKVENVSGGEHGFSVLSHNGVGWSTPLTNKSMRLMISHSNRLTYNPLLTFLEFIFLIISSLLCYL